MVDLQMVEMNSPIGILRIIGTEDHVLEILFEEAEVDRSLQFWKSKFPNTGIRQGELSGAVAKTRYQLEEYFQGKRKVFDVPIQFIGTPFQIKVWKALMKIPYGETRSYREIAESIGHPGAVRAVGSANGKNRIPIIVPCHRVINTAGGLGGYGGGLSRKKMLLNLEVSNRGENL